MAELNLGWAVAWRATAGAVVLTGGGVTLCVVAVVGLPGRDPSQRALAVLFGLALLAVGLAAFYGVRKFGLRASVDDTGLRIRQRDDGFDLRWDELRSIGLTAEKRSVGRGRAWFYTLTFSLAADRPELALWREGSGYRYELGSLGFAGRRLNRELARAGDRYAGLRRI